ncbi:MAG: hypothetical protein ACOY33_10560 [Pseudomonadota bacterium]
MDFTEENIAALFGHEAAEDEDLQRLKGYYFGYPDSSVGRAVHKASVTHGLNRNCALESPAL